MKVLVKKLIALVGGRSAAAKYMATGNYSRGKDHQGGKTAPKRIGSDHTF